MRVVALYCPNCGAPVGKDAKFCSQCGSPIVIDDGVKRSEHVHRVYDEARMREAEMRFQIEKQKTAQKKQQNNVSVVFFIAWIIFMIFMFSKVFR